MWPERMPQSRARYFSPNRSVRELRDLARVGSAIDPLRDFSEVAREEMRLFKFR
jgi:hypothetical protein